MCIGRKSAAHNFRHIVSHFYEEYDANMATQIGQQATHDYAMQRRWQRLKIDVPLRVIAIRPDKTRIVSGRGTEVSEGGLAVAAGIELRIGDEMWVEFTPPYSGEPIRVRAVVRNRSGYRYGVEFLSESADESERNARLRELLRFASGT